MIKVLALIGALLTGLGVVLAFTGSQDQANPAPPASSTTSSPTETATPTREPSTTHSSSAASRQSTPTSSTSSATAAATGHDHGDGPEASKQAAAVEPARKVASRLVKELARSDRSAPAWHRAAEQLMTEDGRGQLAEMKPTDVPFTKVTGAARLVMTNQPSAATVPIGVPTDDGIWLVMVTKEGSQWKALSFSQMEGQP